MVVESGTKYITNDVMCGIVYGSHKLLTMARHYARDTGQQLQGRALHYLQTAVLKRLDERMALHSRNARLFRSIVVGAAGGDYQVETLDAHAHGGAEPLFHQGVGSLVFIRSRHSLEAGAGIIHRWRNLTATADPGLTPDLRAGFGWLRTSARAYEGTRLNQRDAPTYLRVSCGIEPRGGYHRYGRILTPSLGQRSNMIKPQFRASWGRQAGDILLHDVAELDTSPPPFWKNGLAVAQYLEDVHYQATGGMPSLRVSIAKWMLEHYGRPIDPSNIWITNGIRSTIRSIAGHLMSRGERLLVIGAPIYAPLLTGFIELTSQIDMVPWHWAGNRWGIDQQELYDALEKPMRVILLNSPHNPTGSVLGAPTLAAIADAAEYHDAVILNDEAYLDFVDPQSLPTYSPIGANRTVVVGSFCKVFNLNGLRISHVIDPGGILNRVGVNSWLEAPSVLSESVLRACLEHPSAALWVKAQNCDIQSAFERALSTVTSNPFFGAKSQSDAGFFLWVSVPSAGEADAGDLILEKLRIKARSGRKFMPYDSSRARITVPLSPTRLGALLDRLRRPDASL